MKNKRIIILILIFNLLFILGCSPTSNDKDAILIRVRRIIDSNSIDDPPTEEISFHMVHEGEYFYKAPGSNNTYLFKVIDIIDATHVQMWYFSYWLTPDVAVIYQNSIFIDLSEARFGKMEEAPGDLGTYYVKVSFAGF